MLFQTAAAAAVAINSACTTGQRPHASLGAVGVLSSPVAPAVTSAPAGDVISANSHGVLASWL